MKTLPVGADFDHLVLTRFSARFAVEQGPPEEEWLWYRLAFFADACVASMRAQTERNVRWLVWFDPRCSEDFRHEVEALAVDTFEPIWTTDVFWTSYREEVAARASAPYLITTRLDNDDAVATDFIASVQAAFEETDRLVIDFPRGLQVDRSGAVYADYDPTNHFASLVERRSEATPATVFVTNHPRLRWHAPVRRIDTHPMWLEVVHGANVTNAIRGTRVSPRSLNTWFVIDLAYREAVGRRTLWAEKARSQATRWRRRLSDPRAGATWVRSVGQRARGSRTLPIQRRPDLIGRAAAARSRLARRR